MIARMISGALLAAALFFAVSVSAGEVVHEKYEWSDMWVVNADKDSGPRVLLVGDSIVKGYYSGVEKALGDGVNCARYATSKFLSHPDYLGELGLLVKRFNFDVIHINNGLHGWGYTEAQYREGLEALIAFLEKESPDSKLVWCMTTPVRESSDLSKPNEEKTARVLERNAIAAAIMEKNEIPVNDLFSLVNEHDDFFSPDGVHFSDAGKQAEANRVAETIRPLLPK